MRSQKISILFFLVATFLNLLSEGQSVKNIYQFNPTGSYKYDGKTQKKNGEIYGYFGDIQVKLLNENRIAVSFYLCVGAKSYNSGSFVDTLSLIGNTAIYKPLDCDSLCTITFKFSKGGVTTIHKALDGNYNGSCCFGSGVIANGFFRKVSNKIPVIKDKFAD